MKRATKGGILAGWLTFSIAVLSLPIFGVAQGKTVEVPAGGKVKFELKSDSKSDITVKGEKGQPAKYKYKITDKNGKTEEHEFEGTEITLKDKEDCTIEVEVGGHRSLPSATWQGTYDPGSYIEFHFGPGLGGGIGRSILQGTTRGTFPGMPDPVDHANVQIPPSFNPAIEITGSSVPLLGGKAETGPIRFRLDPGRPITGQVNLKTRTYTARVALLMDAPNFREVDPAGREGPLHLVELVSGRYSFTEAAAPPRPPTPHKSPSKKP